MESWGFTPYQQDVIQNSFTGRLFLEGPAGAGKSTAGAARMKFLLEQGIPGEQIITLLPQRSLAQPYYQVLNQGQIPGGGLPAVLTLSGLAQRMIHLFWPAIKKDAGFVFKNGPATFLTLETAQYYMGQVVRPLLDQGYFEQVVIDRNRLYSQILDNLNKAALVNFDHTQIAEKLKNAWSGKPAQLVGFDQAQECANQFRALCLENNLLDFSLQIEIFYRHLWPSYLVQQYLQNSFRHLIYDNIEEDAPVAHDVIARWLPGFDSALLIFDQGGGNRIFLGADPDHAYQLRELCEQQVQWPDSLVESKPIHQFRLAMEDSIQRTLADTLHPAVRHAFTHMGQRFYTETIDQVCEQIRILVQEEQVPPGEIAVLAPFLSDSLRHSILIRLERFNIPARTQRPSRSLRDEPAARCLLTLARLAHPDWGFKVTDGEFRSMLLQALSGLDLVRADLIKQVLFKPARRDGPLLDFDPVLPEMQERITYSVGERYKRLREWLREYQSQSEPAELDVFFARLFGELLSQPGFAFQDAYDAASVTARLIESVQKFRRVAEPALRQADVPIGKEYLQMVEEGVISALYLQPVDLNPDAVLLAPAYTFLMANTPVRFQFWLDAGGLSWWERLFQPLTHPYVLSRRWQPNAVWTDADEYNANQQALTRLVRGLALRCKEHIFLCTARINERGAEERGPLLQALQLILRRMRLEDGSHV